MNKINLQNAAIVDIIAHIDSKYWMLPGRRRGNTTRLADISVQLVLEGKIIKVVDHSGVKSVNKTLCDIIIKRLEAEHQLVVMSYNDYIEKDKEVDHKTLVVNKQELILFSPTLVAKLKEEAPQSDMVSELSKTEKTTPQDMVKVRIDAFVNSLIKRDIPNDKPVRYIASRNFINDVKNSTKFVAKTTKVIEEKIDRGHDVTSVAIAYKGYILIITDSNDAKIEIEDIEDNE